jgi:hypothetical protein
MRSCGAQLVLLVAALAAILVPQTASAQVAAGVAVDAEGVLRLKTVTDQGGRLTKEHAAAAKATLGAKVANHSSLRKISLKHLERAILDKQGALSEEMRYLAGMLRVRYVFYYPESQDIVLAGPAEGWMTDAAGRAVGIQGGRPVVQLQDLAVALRAFPPGQEPTHLIGCSIDPSAEGLAAMQQFLRSVGSRATPNDTQYIVNGLQTNLGLQTISVNGVSPKTHFAQVLVEADYRMKLIGIGLEAPPVRLVSYVERANPAQVSRNALVRWFFTPDYQCVRTSGDGLAMELVGDGVKVVGADELVGSGGQRQSAGRADAASHAFVTSFTKLYSELADRSPVYAELRNMIDLSVAAAYIQQQNLYAKADWKMEVLGDEKVITVETYNAPKQVATAVNAIWKGHRLMTPVGGGVQIQPLMALAPEKRLADKDASVDKLRQQTKLELAKGQWWWD